MTMTRPTLLAWSTGKDSAWTLHTLRQSLAHEYEVVGLLTTLNVSHGRVAMHAVREELLHAQAAAVGLPVQIVELPWPCPNEVYEQRMAAAVQAAVARGVQCMAFGDLFLDDVRRYREEKLAGTGLQPVFPLWKRPTAGLAREMIAAGLRATITCVDPAQLPATFIGREFDAALLDELPASADPCGENGEFHTFVHAGPMFAAPLAVRTGEVVERDGFVFADVLPAPE
ncbi:MAG: ATP-binding protein [Planctomycetota bacterium]